MEFNTKLQELRRQKGLTQEEVAQALFVSRAAVSKWESGRGYPNLDSLKAIARFYGVTVDELLSGEALLDLAEASHKSLKDQLRDLIFGCLDLSAVLFLFMPLFGQKSGENFISVPLLSLNPANPHIKIFYLICVAAMALWGLVTLLLQNREYPRWRRCSSGLSLLLNAGGVFLFIVTSQPYPAAFAFLFLLIKGIFLLKKP